VLVYSNLHFSFAHFLRFEVIVIAEAKFDKEYSTQWLDEVNFLREHGVRYIFVKEINGIATYK